MEQAADKRHLLHETRIGRLQPEEPEDGPPEPEADGLGVSVVQP